MYTQQRASYVCNPFSIPVDNMVASKFSECFWDTDYNSTTGFDVLVKRIKDGRNSVKEIESFLKERSKIEEEYSKSLFKLSKTPLGTESGTLRDVFTALKDDVEKAATVHQDMSRSVGDVVQHIHTVRERETTQCKQAEDTVKKLQAIKKDHYSKMQSGQQNYQRKAQAHEDATKVFASEKSLNRTAKELEKLENKSARCKDEMLKADDIYRNSVQLLEVTRASWEKEMESMCEIFEQTEFERIKFMRNYLWIYINTDSKALYDQDQGNEDVRSVMERCDPHRDIQDFINANQTGCSRPAPALYEGHEAVRPSSAGKSLPRPPPNRPIQPPSNSSFFTTDIRRAPPDDLDDDPLYSSIP